MTYQEATKNNRSAEGVLRCTYVQLLDANKQHIFSLQASDIKRVLSLGEDEVITIVEAEPGSAKDNMVRVTVEEPVLQVIADVVPDRLQELTERLTAGDIYVLEKVLDWIEQENNEDMKDLSEYKAEAESILLDYAKAERPAPEFGQAKQKIETTTTTSGVSIGKIAILALGALLLLRK